MGLRRRLQQFSPFGPIFAKELRITARRKRTYWLRFLYLAALLLALLFFYEVAMRPRLNASYSVAARAESLAEMGALFFAVFGFFTLTSMLLIGPILTCTAINSERLHKTLPILLMTPISAWQIVAGKLTSRLLIAFTLIGLSLPVLAVVRLLGGVEVPAMFGVLCINLSVAFTAAALGLLLSTLMNRPYAVILLAYGVMGLAYLLVPMVLGLIIFELLRGTRSGLDVFFMHFMKTTNPFFEMAVLVVPDRPPVARDSWPWLVFTHVLLGFGLLALCAVVLRRMARKEGRSESPTAAKAMAAPPLPVAQDERAAALSTPSNMAIPTPISLKRHPPAREVSDNPVLWRELRRPLIPRLWQRIVSIIAVIGVLILLYGLLLANHDLHRPETHIGFAIIFYLLLALLACVLAGTAIAQEKESDTWTLLLATPLSARSIVLGKLWGLLRRLMWPAALFVAHFLLFAFTGVLAWRSVAIVVWITFCTCALWLVCGLYFSLRLKTVTFAVTFSLLVPVVLYGVFGATIAILGEIFDRSGRWGETLAVYWPMHYLGIAIDHFSRRHEEFEIEMPCLGRISPEVFVGWVIFIGLAYLAASATVLFYTIARFNRIVGRASQLKPLPTWAIGVLPGHTA